MYRNISSSGPQRLFGRVPEPGTGTRPQWAPSLRNPASRSSTLPFRARSRSLARARLRDLSQEDEAVAVDRFDVRRAAGELARVDGRDPAREGGAVGPDQLDAVAGSEVAVPARDADREEAPPLAGERPPGAVVHVDSAAHLLAVPEPELERRLAGAGRREARTA